MEDILNNEQCHVDAMWWDGSDGKDSDIYNWKITTTEDGRMIAELVV